MRRVLPLLAVLALAGPPALAQSYYLSHDVPTNRSLTFYLPSDVVRNDAGAYSLKMPLPGKASIDGVHQMCSGAWLFSVEAPTELPPVSLTYFGPQDVILYDPITGAYSMFFDGAASGVPAGANVDTAFLDGGDSADLILSFDIPTTISWVTYEPADLVRYSAGTFSLYFDASATTPPLPLSTNVTGADRWGGSGTLVLSFDVPTVLNLVPYVPGELVSWDGTTFASFYLDSTWPLSSVVSGFAFLAAPGSVPNTSLRVAPSAIMPGDLTLTWSAATSAGGEDYGIYEGTIGSWYGHASRDCHDDGADLTEEVTPSTGDTYYLVVPFNPNSEGSYGRATSGAERPQGTLPCKTIQDLTCP